MVGVPLEGTGNQMAGGAVQSKYANAEVLLFTVMEMLKPPIGGRYAAETGLVKCN